MSDQKAQQYEVAGALQQIVANGLQFMQGEDGAREKLVASARALIFAAEDPMDTLLWHVWLEPTRLAAARVAVDLQLFQRIVQAQRPMKLQELAAAASASPELVRRIARACVSMRMLDESGVDEYVANKLTYKLVHSGGIEGIVFCFESGQPSFTRIPQFLRERQFANPRSQADPTQPSQGPFQFGQGTTQTIFEWFTSTRPDVAESFNSYIHLVRQHRPKWTDMYPAKEQLADGLILEGDASALVDVGGNLGQALAEFDADVPEYKGRLVNQDLDFVIKGAESQPPEALNERVELQVHNFFEEQPVKGARAYFLRMVLHDWSDDDSRKILGHLKDAMTPGYSKILICDCVVADEKAAWQHIGLDLFMMALASSHERTKTQWQNLIESCGLEISHVYSKGEGNESLIEVILPESV